MSIRVAVIIGLRLVGITGGTIGPGFFFLIDGDVFGFAGIIVVVEQNAVHVVSHVFHGERRDRMSLNSSSFFEVVKSEGSRVFAVVQVRD